MRNMPTTILRYLNSISAKLSFFMVLERHSVMQSQKDKKASFSVILNSKIQQAKKNPFFPKYYYSHSCQKISFKKYVWSRSTQKLYFGGRGNKHCKCRLQIPFRAQSVQGTYARICICNFLRQISVKTYTEVFQLAGALMEHFL